MNIFFLYSETTRDVTVRVMPSFLADQSGGGRWVWSYHIRIENGGDVPVQLISRHWIITDALGQVEEVVGAGVVGDQPVIQPGRSYDYVSGCPLTTPSGIMRGTYQMVDADGHAFDVVIPAFSLDSPEGRRLVN